MRQGTRLGLDVGTVRVGVARCDREGLLATPVVTLSRAEAVRGVVALIEEWEPLEIVVGLPISLAGRHTASTQDAKDFATELSQVITLDIRMVDERLSTVSASAGLRQAGKSAKKQRGMIDQAAAVILLQHALDAERLQGVPPGFLRETG